MKFNLIKSTITNTIYPQPTDCPIGNMNGWELIRTIEAKDLNEAFEIAYSMK